MIQSVSTAEHKTEDLRRLSGKDVPDAINFERGQVVDIISDYSQYFYGKKVAMAGDPDQILALVEFVITLGMIPAYTVTGTAGKYFDERMKALKPRVAFQVDNILIGEGKLNVDLTFDSMDDFLPDAVARKVEPLNKLLEARTQLSNLLTYMDGKNGAEELIAKILQDPTLLKSLSQLPKNDESAKGSEE